MKGLIKSSKECDDDDDDDDAYMSILILINACTNHLPTKNFLNGEVSPKLNVSSKTKTVKTCIISSRQANKSVGHINKTTIL